MDPLALFALVEECLCVLPDNVDEGKDEELELEDEPIDEALDVGPDGGVELLPLMLLVVEFDAFGAALLLDDTEEGGVCDGRACGNPGIG